MKRDEFDSQLNSLLLSAEKRYVGVLLLTLTSILLRLVTLSQ